MNTKFHRQISTIISCLFIFFFLLFSVLPAGAEDFTSTNFKVRAPVIDDFGGISTSTSFQFTNAGSQKITGESTSTNFIVRAGFLYIDTFTPRSQNWRWYDDETNETPVTPLAAENTAPIDVVNQNVIKLRLTIFESAGVASTSVKFKLQFSQYSDFSQASDVVEIGSCTGNSLWCYVDGAGVDNATNTSKVLTDADACSGGVGDGCGTHNESATSTTSAFWHKKNAAAEYEFTVKHAGAQANATYFFRAWDLARNVAVPLGPSKAYPSLSTQGATLTFTIDGLGAGTATEGVTTDVATTPTSIPFGSLSFNIQTSAAQRLTVSTDATNGYEIFMFKRQSFIHSSYGNTEIDPVTGTNASPTSFAAGCAAAAAGCYGYHAGDDTLAGGSIRFSPNDTYAQFSAAAEEVAFSSIPVASEANDVVLKTKVTNQQPSGDYSSSIVYIVVPTF